MAGYTYSSTILSLQTVLAFTIVGYSFDISPWYRYRILPLKQQPYIDIYSPTIYSIR